MLMSLLRVMMGCKILFGHTEGCYVIDVGKITCLGFRMLGLWQGAGGSNWMKC